MTIERVDETLPKGIRALQSLLMMIEKVAIDLSIAPSASPSQESIGFYLNQDHNSWIGINYNWPSWIAFDAYAVKNQRYLVELIQSNDGNRFEYRGKDAWGRQINLESEKFFDKPKDKQIEWLKEMLSESMVYASKLHNPD
jgi:hypothetical protein